MNYYERPEISNSTLSSFSNLGAAKFKWLRDKGIEVDTIAMKKGRAFHCYLLERDKFKDTFKVHDFVYPETPNQKAFAKSFYDVPADTPVDEAAHLAMKQSYKQHSYDGAQKLLKNLLPYLQYVEWTEEGIPVISNSELISIENAYHSIKSSPLVWNQLFETSKDEEVFYELEIYWTHPLFPNIELKSKLDHVRINHATKIARVIDLKSTKDASEFNFKFEINRYKIHKQISFYTEALSYFLLENNYIDYFVDHRIIAVELKEPYISNVFRCNEQQTFLGRSMWLKELQTLNWHIANDIWISKEVYEKGYVNIEKYNTNASIIEENEI